MLSETSDFGRAEVFLVNLADDLSEQVTSGCTLLAVGLYRNPVGESVSATVRSKSGV